MRDYRCTFDSVLRIILFIHSLILFFFSFLGIYRMIRYEVEKNGIKNIDNDYQVIIYYHHL